MESLLDEEQLKSVIINLKNEESRLRLEVKNRQQDVSDIANKIIKKKDEMAILEKEVYGINKNKDSMLEQISKAKNEYDAYVPKFNELKEDIKKLESFRKDLSKNLSKESEIYLKGKEAECESLKNKSIIKANEYDGLNKSLNEKIAELNSSIKVNKEKEDVYKKQSIILEEENLRIAAIRKDIEDKEKDIIKYKHELDEKKHQQEIKDGMYEEKRAEIDNKINILNEKTKDFAIKIKQIENKNINLDLLIKENNEKSAILKKKETELNQLIRENEETKKQLQNESIKLRKKMSSG